MKKSIAVFGILLSTLCAHADMIVDMDLDLSCSEAQGDLFSPAVVRIISDGKKTEIIIGGKTYTGAAMGGGTEGGPFYSQYSDRASGISVNFFGGDIEKLNYNTKSIKNATTPAQFSYSGRQHDLICKGKLGWIGKKW
jgi:hypothetical protein